MIFAKRVVTAAVSKKTVKNSLSVQLTVLMMLEVIYWYDFLFVVSIYDDLF